MPRSQSLRSSFSSSECNAMGSSMLTADSTLYQPKAGATDYRCPNCWMREAQSIRLKPIPFERPDEDIMRCPNRGRDFGISLRA